MKSSDEINHLIASTKSELAELESRRSDLLAHLAESQLSPQVLLHWTLCGKVNYLNRNGVKIAEKSEECAYLKAGGSSKVVNTPWKTNPHGTFTVQTYHQFIQAGGWSWKPTVPFSTTLP